MISTTQIMLEKVISFLKRFDCSSTKHLSICPSGLALEARKLDGRTGSSSLTTHLPGTPNKGQNALGPKSTRGLFFFLRELVVCTSIPASLEITNHRLLVNHCPSPRQSLESSAAMSRASIIFSFYITAITLLSLMLQALLLNPVTIRKCTISGTTRC